MSLHTLVKKFGGLFLGLVCVFVGCSGQEGGANPFYNPEFNTPDTKPEPEPEVTYGKLYDMTADSVYEKYQNSPHVAYYSASWCGWCNKQTPLIERLAKANPKILFVKVNADTCRDAVRRNNVSGLPTIFVKKVKFTGFTDESKLQSEIDRQFKKTN